jgi:DNA-binding beta-propeller fold protein YncE
MFIINSTTGILAPSAPATVATGATPFLVVVDAGGNFVYVTNQGDNTVSIYSVNSDGTLTSAGTVATGGEPDVVALTH